MKALTLQPRRWQLTVAMVFALFALVLAYVLRTRGISTHGDDAMYAKALGSGPVLDYVQGRYRTWSGRVLIDAATVLLINHVVLWRWITGACLIGIAGWMALATRNGREPAAIVFACAALFLIHPETFYGAGWWMTGSFNYLWVWSAALLAFIPFVRPDAKPWLFALCWLAAIYAGSHEQGGLLLFGFQLLASIGLLRNRKFRWPHALSMLTVIVCFVSVVSAPGTLQRFKVVTLLWFPQYLEWSLDERIFAGFELAFGHGFRLVNLLAGVFYLLLPILVFQRVADPWKRLISLVPLAVYLLPLLSIHVLSDLGSGSNIIARIWGYQNTPGRTSDGYEPFGLTDYTMVLDSALYWHFFLVASGTACVGMSIANAALEGRYFGRAAPVIVFGAALLSSAVLGMSPTLYASGQRIFFFQDALIALLAVIAFSQIRGVALQRALVAGALLLAAFNLWTVVSRTVQ